MGEEYFYFNNGRIAKDLWDLGMVLQTLSEQDFNHHVNREKNDFASWVEFSLGNRKFADELRKTSSLENMRRLLSDYFSREVTGTIRTEEALNADEHEIEKNEADISEKQKNLEQQEENPESDNKETIQETIQENMKDIYEKEPENNYAPNYKKFSETRADGSDGGRWKEKNKDSILAISRPEIRWVAKHSIKPLLLGAGFGIILGMIIMLILVKNGVL